MDKRNFNDEQETREKLCSTLNALKSEPPESLRPAAIIDKLEQQTKPSTTPARRRPMARWLVPLAACLVLTIGLFPVFAPSFMRKGLSSNTDGKAEMTTSENASATSENSFAGGTGNNSGAQDSVQDSAPESLPVFTPETLQKMLEGGALLVDVREPSELAGGYIEGMINIPLGELKSSIAHHAPDKKRMIIVYCRTGNRSGQAQRLLMGMGYTTVYNLGGIQTDWPYPTVR